MQDLRRDARRLENELDAKLVQYSRLDVDGDSAGRAPLQREVEREIDQHLQELAEVNDRMSREAANASGSATTMHTLQRHRDGVRSSTTFHRRIAHRPERPLRQPSGT